MEISLEERFLGKASNLKAILDVATNTLINWTALLYLETRNSFMARKLTSTTEGLWSYM